MTSTAPIQSRATGDLPGSGPGKDTARMTWAALGDAAGAVAALAGIELAGDTHQTADFPAFVAEGDGWRRDHAERGIADLAAVMAQGLAALLAAREHGSHAPAAAHALLREFHAAKAAILALAPPPPEAAPGTRTDD